MRSCLLALAVLCEACGAPGPVAAPAADSRRAEVERGLVPAVVVAGRPRGRSVAERMAHHRVPALGVAVIDGGRVAWAAGYGAGVSVETVFLTAAAQVDEATLARLELHHTGAVHPLPETWRALAAVGHDVEGRPLPEPAAGLWTTPSDRAQLVLSRTVEVRSRDALPGYRAAAVLSGDGLQGAVVMASGDGGGELVEEVLRGIAAVYGWRGFPGPIEKQVAAIDPAVYADYAGKYTVGALTVEVSVDGGALTIRLPDGTAAELLPEAPDRFFLLERDAAVTFERDPGRVVTGLTAHLGARTVRAVRQAR